MPFSRRTKRWSFVLLVIVLGLAGLRLGRNHIARKALERVALVAQKGGYSATFEGVDFSLIGNHFSITGLVITPLADSLALDSLSTFSIRADEIDLQGVDLNALLKEGVLRVGHVRIRAPELAHAFVTRVRATNARSDAAPDASSPKAKGLDVVHVDTLQILGARGHSQDRAKANPAVSVSSLDLEVIDITITEGEDGKAGLTMGSARLNIHEAKAHLEPYYNLHIDSLRVLLPEDSAVIFGLRFTPEVHPKQYHKEVDTQVELYEALVDTILLTGFDLAAKLEDGALLAKALYIAGIQVDVYRDKSIPITVERPRKALLAEKIQSWSVPVALANIEIRHGRVTYHERLKKGEDYGSLTLAAIHAKLTGITNMGPDGHTDLQLVGDARVWDKAQAHLDLRMSKHEGPTQVTIVARMRDLSATELSRMTDDLLHVRATHGRIHKVEMHMNGNDIQATGTVDLHYDSLRIELAPTVEHAGLLTHLANTVVRSTNMPDVKGYRVGHFTADRRQDASVFNYLWVGLREGMMDVMLPPLVLDQLHKQSAKKKNKGHKKD